MHQLLENYLAEVETCLQPLPTAQRNEELREIRSHLLNAVVVNQEIMEMPQEEAIKTAIEQFGDPQECGKGAVWAWQRGERKEDKRSFIGATICAGVLASVTSSLVFLMMHPFYTTGFQTLTSFSIWLAVIPMLLASFARMAVVGGISGFVFPKQAVMGSLVAVTAHMAFVFSQQLLVRFYIQSAQNPANIWLSLGVNLVTLAIDLVAVAISAKVVSRWRLAQLARI